MGLLLNEMIHSITTNDFLAFIGTFDTNFSYVMSEMMKNRPILQMNKKFLKKK